MLIGAWKVALALEITSPAAGAAPNDRSPPPPNSQPELEPMPARPEPEPRPEPAPPIDERPRAEFGIELSGFIGVFGSDRTGGFTFGGPRIGLTVGRFGMGLSFYPSLIGSTLWPTQRVRPTLGVGGEISYYGVTLFVPVYLIGERYLPAGGIGYRFSFSRKVARRGGRSRRSGRR